ncbi:30S ribosomal protein S4 [Microgenomates group bacterium]|nr:30S ribosomal protein S4 [Microgenomates group bacterium]
MARYTGPKTRLSRRFGEDLGLKTNSLKTLRRIAQPAGQHGAKRRGKLSQYGLQLREKQKLKAIYGILEKPLVKIYKIADALPMATGAAMLSMLERRLDNVVYRLGWATTRATARQLVNHNHFLVNNKTMNIPSYQVKTGDVITIRPKSAKINLIADLLKDNKAAVPAWLEAKGAAAKVVTFPDRAQIGEKIDEQLIVEFYSR